MPSIPKVQDTSTNVPAALLSLNIGGFSGGEK